MEGNGKGLIMARVSDFAGQWTVPQLATAPPPIGCGTRPSSNCLGGKVGNCRVCGLRRPSVRSYTSQLVLIRDYTSTLLTVYVVNIGRISAYEGAPTYAMVLPPMCGQCEDMVTDAVAAENYDRVYHLPPDADTCLLPPLVAIVNDYLRLVDD